MAKNLPHSSNQQLCSAVETACKRALRTEKQQHSISRWRTVVYNAPAAAEYND